MKYISNIIVPLCTIFHLIYCSVHCYTCSTPEGSLNTINKLISEDLLPTGIGGKWPNGVVKYHMNSSLTENDKIVVYQAFDEYHKSTCIRFEPYSEGDTNYVSIELDNSVCGVAHVCMQGRYQNVKFGQNCRNMNNIIHQLGHTLCLTHEENRHKGNKFVDAAANCSGITQAGDGNRYVNRIYDEASQMHVGCDSENKCGHQITAGLSALDVDYINALYDCQGCYRHRWIPKESLKPISSGRFYSSFLWTDLDHSAIYPCRAFFKGDVTIGKYNTKEEACYVGSEGKEFKLCQQFEVLIFPGGAKSVDTAYVLQEILQNMSEEEKRSVLEDAVVAGRLSWEDKMGSMGQGYVAFGVIEQFKKSCNYTQKWWAKQEEKNVDVIGRAWQYNDGIRAYASLCNADFRLYNYQVLTCKKRENQTESLGPTNRSDRPMSRAAETSHNFETTTAKTEISNPNSNPLTVEGTSHANTNVEGSASRIEDDSRSTSIASINCQSSAVLYFVIVSVVLTSVSVRNYY